MITGKHYLASLVLLLTIFSSGCQTTGPREVPQETLIHIRPAWSPDGSTIAFTGGAPSPQGIYLVDTIGSTPVMIKAGEGIGVTWSPDSRWIAYSAFRRLYKMTVSGDSTSSIASTTNDIRPAWSPDGDKIVYVNNGLKLVILSTGEVSSLLGYGNYPSWRNQDEIVFLDVGAPSNPQLRSYNIVTQQSLSLGGFSGFLDIGFTSINSQGTAIVFAGYRLDAPDYSQVFHLSLTDSSLRQLTVDGGTHPAWSPDGVRIVYTRTQSGDGGLWIMNADGTEKRRLTRP